MHFEKRSGSEGRKPQIEHHRAKKLAVPPLLQECLLKKQKSSAFGQMTMPPIQDSHFEASVIVRSDPLSG